MQRDQFKNFDVLQDDVSWKNMKTAGLLESRVIEYSNDYKVGFKISGSYSRLDCKEINWKRKVGGKVLTLLMFSLNPDIRSLWLFQNKKSLTFSKCSGT